MAEPPTYFRVPFKGQMRSAVLFVSVIIVLCRAQDTSTIRLTNGATPNEGRVEILSSDGRGWGTICDHGWDYYDATVVCRQLGFPGVVYATPDSRFGGSKDLPVLRENVACTSTEDTLDECAASRVPSASCTHADDAGVVCMVPGYYGCYSLYFTATHQKWTIILNSNDACADLCVTKGYKYAASNGFTCRCGMTSAYFFYVEYTDQYCNALCPGNGAQLCGNGRDLYTVFDTTLGSCSDPGSPLNGRRVGETFEYGARVTFSCFAGYVLRGDSELQCILGSSPDEVMWSGSTPECLSPSTVVIEVIQTTPTYDVTDELMTELPVTGGLFADDDSLGTTLGIAIGVIFAVIIFIILGILFLLYVKRRKREVMEQTQRYRPEVLEKRAPSNENIYEIEETDVVADEIRLPPSTSNGVHNPTTAVRNGHGPPSRALPSIHLYADVTLTQDEMISPSSDYGTSDDVEQNGLSSVATDQGDAEVPPSNPGQGKRYYFVLEDAVPSKQANASQPEVVSPQSHTFTPSDGQQDDDHTPKMDHGHSASNLLYEVQEGHTMESEADERAHHGSREDDGDAQGYPSHDESCKYVNSEFHSVPKSLEDNPLYKPSNIRSLDATETNADTSAVKPGRSRSSSEAETRVSPPASAGNTTEHKLSSAEDTEPSDATSPCYMNTEFHEMPELMDNVLYKPCTNGVPGDIS